MEIFDASKCTTILDQRIKTHVDMLSESDLNNVLGIIQVGDNPVSESYIKLKIKYCQRFGIRAQLFKLDQNLSDQEITDNITSIFARPEISGGIIQLPLPRTSLNGVLNLIPLKKDIDMLSSNTWVQYDEGKRSITSPVVLAMRAFLDTYSIDIHGMSIKIIGRGRLVGVPIAKYLLSQGVNPEFLDDYTTGDSLKADLAITSTGIARLIKGENINEGCSVIDFGSSIVDGKTVGDFDLSSKTDHLKFISPSPGGMGPLVLRYLIMNFLGLEYSNLDFQQSQ
ncbi:hypothetical protein A2415_00095 [candidate division WWE3 bacterium RIFOXYC1_FULL_39_7]|uniref:Methenyltetrahydrofolate cyclohydrolase n=2 Tax=Katanobacteria TaxID=422282 RepID=A0A1F4X576_UNCKA|nr:MAG: hypothetical protein A2415_00095 [candidate division WWE3 bacterium RIFOXYC1_FULL_39_7]OGC76749.1 MAG: hypothetical protein A2619_02415 [candidate division WWE3 bacterium RIFOXYD1_FULL_39_9]